MKFETIKNILLALFSVCVGIVFIEFAIGLLVPIRDVGPSFTQYDPVLGKRLRPSFTTIRRTPEFTMTFSTNSLGFRGADVRAMPRNPILFLGDSFTMGYGVNDGEEFPAVVASRLKEQPATASIPVVNAGVGDTGNGRWIKLLRTWKDVMQPRLVVMQVVDSDFQDNVTEQLFTVTPDGVLRELPVPTWLVSCDRFGCRGNVRPQATWGSQFAYWRRPFSCAASKIGRCWACSSSSRTLARRQFVICF